MVTAAKDTKTFVSERIMAACEITTSTQLRAPVQWTVYQINICDYLKAALLGHILDYAEDDPLPTDIMDGTFEMEVGHVRDIISSSIHSKYLNILPATAYPKDVLQLLVGNSLIPVHYPRSCANLRKSSPLQLHNSLRSKHHERTENLSWQTPLSN